MVPVTAGGMVLINKFLRYKLLKITCKGACKSTKVTVLKGHDKLDWEMEFVFYLSVREFSAQKKFVTL